MFLSNTVYCLEQTIIRAFIMLSEYFVFNRNADLSRAVLRVMEEKGILLSKMSVSGLAAVMTGHENLSHLRNKR